MKKCITCKKEKQVTEYRNQAQREDGLYPTCKVCARRQHNEWRRTRMGLAQDMYKRQKVNAKKRNNSVPRYGKAWFVEWVLGHTNFEKIYTERVDSGYEKDLGPSVDRIDDSRGYYKDNIRLVTWGENNRKQYQNKKNGVNPKNCMKVYQFTLKGEILRSYHSVAEAKRVTGISSILKAAHGEVSQAGGYKRSFTTKL